MPPLIEYHNATVLRGGREVLNGLTLRIDSDEHVAIIGPNGSGKSTLSRNLTFADSRSLGNNQFEAKLLRPFGQRSDLLLAISGFVVFGPLVDILLSVFDKPVEQAGQLSSHRSDGFGSAQTGTQATLLRTQITLAAQQGSGC